MSHVPRPGRFLTSRPDSPRPTDSLPPLYPPSTAYRRTERTTTPIHKPARNSPPDLTGQITCERSKWPKVTGGGYGDVWGGVWQNGTETCKVAIKVLRLSHDRDEKSMHKLHKRLRKEIEVWRRLDHKNIVPLYGTTSDFGSEYSTGMVSPWMNNGDLTTYLKRPLSLSERFQPLCDVAAGLEYLHSKNVIHGDLTGSNVLIDHDGTARLIDFGLSTIKPEFDVTSFDSSTIGGAVRWLAPELLPGKPRVLSRPSDIYSLGSVILQALSGKVPYHDLRTVAVVLQLHDGGLPKRPLEPWVTDAHWKLINRCWKKEPDSRPSIQEVRHRLLTFHQACGARSSPHTGNHSSKNLPDPPLLQVSSQKTHKSHIANVAAVNLTPNPLPPLIVKPLLPPTLTTSDRTAHLPNISEAQPRSIKVSGKTPNPNSLAQMGEDFTSKDDKHARRLNTLPSPPLRRVPSHRKVRHSRSDITDQNKLNTSSSRRLLNISTGQIPMKTSRSSLDEALFPCPIADGYEADSPIGANSPNQPLRSRPRSHISRKRSTVNSRDPEEMVPPMPRPVSLSLADTIRSHRKIAAEAVRIQMPSHQ